MDSYLSFLRPISPEKSLDEILDEFRQLNPEQTGEGVVTRRQAREAASQAALTQNDVSPNTVSPQDVQNVGQQDEMIPTSPLPGAEPATMVFNDTEARQQTSGDEPGTPGRDSVSPRAAEAAESELYSNDTLVAENSDLKAYAIQSHFRRMRNFM